MIQPILRTPLLVFLFACLAIGWAQGEPPPGWEIPEGAFPLTDEKATLRVFAPQNPENFETNLFTKWYEEQTNVRVEWLTAPPSEAQQSLNLLLASGDYPDVILMGLERSQVMLYGSQGVFLPLNDFIEQYGDNVNKVFERYPQVKAWSVAPDGNIYGLPQAVECYHCTMSQKMWIYKPWLDKLGLEMPTTTEEFYRVLKAFKEQDPNGNDKADEIPLTSSTGIWNGTLDSFLMNSFVLNNLTQVPNGLIVSDGRLEAAYNQPAYREGLRYLRKLYTEGLILPETFTQNETQLKSLGAGAEVVVGALNAALSGYLVDAPQDPTDADSHFADYVVVPPLKGPEGLRVAPLGNIDGTPKCFVTAVAKDPELAYRWCEAQYMAAIFMRSSWGVEGEDWRWAKDGEIGIDGKPAIYTLFQGVPENANWLGAQLNFGPPERRFAQTNPGPHDLETWLYTSTKQLEPYAQDLETVIPPLYLTAEQAQELADIEATIDRYVDEMFARFTISDADLETEWETYTQTLEQMGLPRMLEIYQTVYDAQK